jgi:type IV pilus assembly protein PilN
MPDINLLPWREELREERKRQFTVVVAGVFILGLLVGYAWEVNISGKIAAQERRNTLLQTGIEALDAEVAEIRRLRESKADMIDRMAVIKGLQTNRPEIVRLFDEFARALPDGAYIEEMNVEGNSLSIEGKAESNNRVSAFMRQLNDSEKFSEPNLTRVDADPTLGDQGSSFTMIIKVDNEEDGEDSPDA